MIVLRYLYVLALVVWLGGTLALSGVVPSFHLAIELCGFIMLTTLVGMRLLGPKPIHFNVRIAIVFAMFAIAMYAGVHQQDAGASTMPMVTQAARRLSFGAVHDLPTAATAVTIVGGLSLLYWEARE